MDATQETAPRHLTGAMDVELLLQGEDLSGRLDHDQANTLYTHAFYLGNQGKHEKACAVLDLLRLYRPHEPKYTLAAAVCLRKLGRYEDAIRMFAQTIELRPDDYSPVFPLVECMLQLGLREQAAELLQKVAGAAEDDGQASIQARAEAMLGFLRTPVQ
ncbi:MAG: tetratricopeptide repeat protein [Burkholderiaceae bacterium]|nr:tetratricopeptide repeat protein [Burkholderiaceae bacterium]